jgi:aminoacyl tRNA synthase complex-interacting multifunctional protein 1
VPQTYKYQEMEFYTNDSIDSKIIKILVTFLKNTKELPSNDTIQKQQEKFQVIRTVQQKEQLLAQILEKNPSGQLPVLAIKTNNETRDGNDEKITAVVVGQKEIINYLLDSEPLVAALLVPNKEEVENWLKFRENELYPAIENNDTNKLRSLLNRLNKQLQPKVYFVSNRISLVDLSIFATLMKLVSSWGEEERLQYLNVTRWFDNIQHRPELFDSLQTDNSIVVIKRNISKNRLLADKRDKNEFENSSNERVNNLKAENKTEEVTKNGTQQKERNTRQQQPQPQPQQKQEQKQRKETSNKESNTSTSQSSKNQSTKTDRPVDVSRFDLRVGKIIQIENHPNADKLYVEQIDLGEEKPRTIVSGLRHAIPIEQMQNRLVVVLCNLEPRKFVGMVSNGMVIAASNEDKSKIELLEPPPGVQIGERIVFDGYGGEPDKELKKKILDQVFPELEINSEGIAVYKKKIPFMTSKGPCKVKSLTNAKLS